VTAPQAFIFDLDGVLVDTIEFHYRAWKKVAEVGNVSFTREDMDHFRGLHRQECLKRLFSNRELSDQEMSAYFSIKDEQFDKSLHAMSAHEILPGVCPLLEEVRRESIKLGVASSSAYAKPVLQKTGLNAYFDAVADAYTVVRGKPEPDIFLWIAAALKVEPGEAVVFEDAAAGVSAAHKVNMFVVGLGAPALVGEADLILPTLAGVHLQQILDAYASLRKKTHFGNPTTPDAGE
jgi:beta-phosphoglucomutase